MITTFLRHSVTAKVLTSVLLTLAACTRGAFAGETALDRYIAKPDSTYSYRLVHTIPTNGYTTYILEMTSQTWLTPAEVDRPVWKHWLNIVRPDDTAHRTALLMIGGGDNSGREPTGVDAMLVKVAMATKSIVAELKMVPNQALVFNNDGKARKEDDLIAYTWDKYLRTGDERWPARLPMTKSAVRALDTITSFCASPEGGGKTVETFVVAGGSKRGWTTWTTAAVDKRVIAIAPLVIDMLNVVPSFVHHWEAYGFWAPAVRDYEAAGIMNWMGKPEYEKLMKIEEPYEYRDRLTLPKLLINASGDQFFLPDSSQFYFADLSGPKFLRYVPNADHSLKGSDAPETLAAWHHAILNRTPLPQFKWTSEKDGTLRVQATDKPMAVKLWQATNPTARDFRVDTIGRTWTSTDLTEQAGGTYVGSVSKPEKGWTALFVEMTYKPTGSPAPLKFTTQVNVVPDVTPFKFKK